MLYIGSAPAGNHISCGNSFGNIQFIPLRLWIAIVAGVGVSLVNLIGMVRRVISKVVEPDKSDQSRSGSEC